MSYDIFFFQPNGPKDLIKQAHANLQHDPAKPSAERDELRRALVDDLLALHGSLRMDSGSQGFSLGCSVASFDINADCDIPDLNIGVSTAQVSISYSADPSMSDPIERILRIFEDHGYVAYDPQQDTILSKNIAGIQERFETIQNAVLTRLRTGPQKPAERKKVNRKKPAERKKVNKRGHE
jgi:hypothetical protein